jgi:H+/Cl- antiporter ClcA
VQPEQPPQEPGRTDHDVTDDRPSRSGLHPGAAVYEVLRGLLRFDAAEHWRLLRFLLGWVALGTVVGALAGVSSATFLTLLARATDARVEHPWLLGFLPAGGFVVGLAYRYVGGRSSQGNNLILEEVHGVEPDGPAPSGERWVPTRMAPLVLFGTLVTHLFGGSAGREGTAIQMSGSLNDGFARLVGLSGENRRLLLIAAIAGGFGSVFGVPLAGTVFALEVQTSGRLQHDALVPSLTAAIVGERVVHLLDWHHDVTPRIQLPATGVDAATLLKVAVAGLAFGLASALFSELVFGLKGAFAALVRWSPLRPAIGGLVVIALTGIVGTQDYLGLSLPLIADSYVGQVALGAFALKLLFTTITLGAGFQGGEVTPLFVIGATLGATMAAVLHVDPALLAAVGFVAVFAGATNTPLACTVMGVELFGTGAFVYLAVGCAISFVFSAHRGIYEAQRVTHTGGEDVLGRLQEQRRHWLPVRPPGRHGDAGDSR